MATRPTVEVSFRQLATTLIERSERGTAILLLKKDEAEGFDTLVFKTVADVTKDAETRLGDENVKAVKAALSFAPYEVVAIVGAGESFADFAPHIKAARRTGWIASPAEGIQSDLASFIKSEEKSGGTFKAVGTEAKQDCKQYVYFNQKGTDETGSEVTALDYLPSLVGILAGCNVEKGCTNYVCRDLASIEEVEDIDAAIKAGQLVLTNDHAGVKIVTGINSLTTYDGSTATEDMSYIETVEAMNLIADDIRDEFVNTYQGKYRNSRTNQLLFIGAVNQYFDALAAEDILDGEYDNRASVDVEAQRAAWIGSGKAEAVDWDEETVKRMTYKRSVFVAADIKVLGCMENLKFVVTLQ